MALLERRASRELAAQIARTDSKKQLEPDLECTGTLQADTERGILQAKIKFRANSSFENRLNFSYLTDTQYLWQLAYPILLGRPHPEGHPAYPGMGSFFPIQGGGGRYPEKASGPSNR